MLTQHASMIWQQGFYVFLVSLSVQHITNSASNKDVLLVTGVMCTAQAHSCLNGWLPINLHWYVAIIDSYKPQLALVPALQLNKHTIMCTKRPFVSPPSLHFKQTNTLLCITLQFGVCHDK